MAAALNNGSQLLDIPQSSILQMSENQMENGLSQGAECSDSRSTKSSCGMNNNVCNTLLWLDMCGSDTCLQLQMMPGNAEQLHSTFRCASFSIVSQKLRDATLHQFLCDQPVSIYKANEPDICQQVRLCLTFDSCGMMRHL